MRHRFSLGLLALLLSFAPSALAQTYVATLAGANEVPPVTTDATGIVFATVDGMDVTISGSFSGLESAYAASHIHTGVAGANGGVIFPLSPTVDADERGGTFDQTLTFSQTQLDALASDGLYVNVHSADNGGGEIRGQLGGPVTAFVNELHYDNASTDEGEFVEIAVPTGTDIDDLVLTLYNGNGGTAYGTFTGDTFAAGATTGGFTLYSIGTPGIQNGAPDGLALSLADGTVLQFLSYEGTFTAADGPASGLTSTDIGVSEDPAPDAGQSLQLTGAGTVADDFTWTGPVAQTRGAANAGQTFGGGGTGGGGVASEGGPDGSLTLVLANPIRGAALVTFGAETAGPVRLVVFDALGREVAVLSSGNAPAGLRSARLDGRVLAPGVYVVRLETAGGIASRTVTVVR
ncbi:CHRD domain-containing protein [Rubrivirga sp. IMCC43871]|uniref:CHRD domain-containing protein n=1 Tax=Rubrivirga sp. IMCC43871 TaxID=3391575 RepID=UPI003990060F